MSPWYLGMSKPERTVSSPNIPQPVDGTNSSSVTGAGDPGVQSLSFPPSHNPAVLSSGHPHCWPLRHFYMVSLSPTTASPPVSLPWSPWFILHVNLVRFLLRLKFLLIPESRGAVESPDIYWAIVCPSASLSTEHRAEVLPVPTHTGCHSEDARRWKATFQLL